MKSDISSFLQAYLRWTHEYTLFNDLLLSNSLFTSFVPQQRIFLRVGGFFFVVLGFLFKGNYIDNIHRTMEEIGVQDEDFIKVVLKWCMTEEMWHKCKG